LFEEWAEQRALFFRVDQQRCCQRFQRSTPTMFPRIVRAICIAASAESKAYVDAARVLASSWHRVAEYTKAAGG